MLADPMQARLAQVQDMVQAELARAIAAAGGDLRDAMATCGAGRQGCAEFLVMESARLHGVSDDAALPVAAAVEALHAYSLVHDDLPAMDDDDLRRGLPTVHVKWSEATAILAGDALQTLAFDLLTDDRIGAAPSRLRLVAALAQAAGARAWSGGRRWISPPKPPERPWIWRRSRGQGRQDRRPDPICRHRRSPDRGR